MGLGRLLGSSSGNAANTKGLMSSSTVSLPLPPTEKGPPEFITDEDDLVPPGTEPEAPDLRELNACLEALAVVFPDIRIEVFREILSKFDGESRLAVAADALLKNRVEWVKGRWRALDGSNGTGRESLPTDETFRSEEYKKAVKALAGQEFRGLSKSSIIAVLAETNYSYFEARRTLVELSSKSWRFTFATLFSSRRKLQVETEPEMHPLVIWKSTGNGAIEPCIKPTGSAELDRELFQQLIVPLKTRQRNEQQLNDHRYAVALNNTEAEEAHETIECACCYADCAFEEFTSCNSEGHMICFRCVQHSISEAVFGQGWQRSIDKQTGSLRCPAVDSEECRGCITQDHLYRAMLEDPKGADILHKLEQRLAEYSLVSSGQPLIRCPFCSYAEVDDIYVPDNQTAAQRQVWAHNIYNLIFITLCICTIPFFLPILLTCCFVGVLFSSKHLLGDGLLAELRAAQARQVRRRRGLRFKCQNPECGQASCLSCNKEWIDVHICNESALVALRTQVEQAMSLAIKRVCPRCNMSFVKVAGCNKLTCPCGYKMCYVCRKDIEKDGYTHYCQHFRPEGDPTACDQCTKCNLWESENTEEILEQAKEEAERKWFASEKRQLSGAERVFLETGMGVRAGKMSLRGVLHGERFPTIAEVFDTIVDIVYA
ncbi:hypothetical protein OQA88_2212 [Cercophora sp. LCS_1]